MDIMLDERILEEWIEKLEHAVYNMSGHSTYIDTIKTVVLDMEEILFETH